MTCEFYFLSVFFFFVLFVFYLKVPPMDAVEGLEEFVGVRDFILPQLHNQTSVREKKRKVFVFLFVWF